MADEEQIVPDETGATRAVFEPAAPTAKANRSRRKKATAAPSPAALNTSEGRSKRYSDEDRLEMLRKIDDQLAGGTTLKDAVKKPRDFGSSLLPMEEGSQAGR
jgi:hypothetical protein